MTPGDESGGADASAVRKAAQDGTGATRRPALAARHPAQASRRAAPAPAPGAGHRRASQRQAHQPAAGFGAVELTDAGVRYRNGALGVSGVSLRVSAGEMVAVFGPNGAGKTSTVRAVSGFLRSEGAQVTGGVLVAGVNAANREPHRITPLGVAFVPERHKLFPSMTVADNLAALGRTVRRPRRRQLQERIFTLFPVLSERAGELAGRLSGGQQQMVAIGRALMTDPSVLIVDELTLGLHHSLHEPLYRAVRRVADEGTAVIVVDESTGFALDFADRCYLFGGGTLKDQGPASRFRGSELLAAGYVEAD